MTRLPSRAAWTDLAESGKALCARCRLTEADTILRLFAQERKATQKSSKTLAGRHIRLCESCCKEVFAFTMEQMERSAANVRRPDDATRDALRYVISYIEADQEGRELTDSIDLDYLRRAAS